MAHTQDMGILSRCAVLFLALFASTVCPAMAVAQTQVPASHHAAVESLVPDCCLNPMGSHGTQRPDGLTVLRVSGDEAFVSIVVTHETWKETARPAVTFFVGDPAPPPDFDRRSVMKRE